MVSKNSGSLMALTSSHRHSYKTQTSTDLHIFTYIPYYYEWIESVTGLKLPQCTGPQVEKNAGSLYDLLSQGDFGSNIDDAIVF